MHGKMGNFENRRKEFSDVMWILLFYFRNNDINNRDDNKNGIHTELSKWIFRISNDFFFAIAFGFAIVFGFQSQNGK